MGLKEKRKRPVRRGWELMRSHSRWSLARQCGWRQRPGDTHGLGVLALPRPPETQQLLRRLITLASAGHAGSRPMLSSCANQNVPTGLSHLLWPVASSGLHCAGSSVGCELFSPLVASWWVCPDALFSSHHLSTSAPTRSSEQTAQDTPCTCQVT